MRSRLHLVCLVALAACSGPGPLEPGEYRFAVTSDFLWSEDPFLLVEADGRFMGRSGREISCAGVLDPREHVRITDALNDADALWRDDTVGGNCADQAVYQFYVATPDDTEWDALNSFAYGPCERWSTPMRHLLDVSFAPIEDHATLDLCTVSR